GGVVLEAHGADVERAVRRGEEAAAGDLGDHFHVLEAAVVGGQARAGHLAHLEHLAGGAGGVALGGGGGPALLAGGGRGIGEIDRPVLGEVVTDDEVFQAAAIDGAHRRHAG